MKYINISLLFSVLFAAAILSSCSPGLKNTIDITDAKIVTGVDEKLMPLEVVDTFPSGTSKVSCWIQWKDARLNTQLMVKWHYITDDVHISDYSLTVPKKEGVGSIDFKMSSDKGLPAGLYRVDICLGKSILRSLTFTIQ